MEYWRNGGRKVKRQKLKVKRNEVLNKSDVFIYQDNDHS